MEKELIINKENAIDTLHRMSAHLGSKLQAAELFSSCDDDKQRIEPMWVAAITELSGLLMPYSSLTLYADKALGVAPDSYVNAGVLLIDLKKVREMMIEERFVLIVKFLVKY